MTDIWQDADWNLFALGSLDEETQRQMQAHLRTQCKGCSRKYCDAVSIMDALAAIVPQEDPSPRVADALLARISSPTQRTSSLEVMPRRRPLVLPWIAVAACALLALGLGVRLERVTSQLRQEQASLTPILTLPPPVKTFPKPAEMGQPITHPLPAPPADLARLRDARTQLSELTGQLADLETQKDAALAQLDQAKNEEARSVAELNRLQSQLASAQEQIRTGGHASEAEVSLLAQKLDVANRTIAELKTSKSWSAQAVAFLQGGPFRQVELRGVDPGAGKATAIALYAPDRGLLVLARSLPALNQEKCYQLWSIHKTGPAILSVGLLKTDASGSGFLYVPPGQDLRQISGLSITDEPKGGSLAAQGHKLLFGAID